jgi:hypothetical protein
MKDITTIGAKVRRRSWAHFLPDALHPAKNRAFRSNLLAKAKRISAAIPCAWAASPLRMGGQRKKLRIR